MTPFADNDIIVIDLGFGDAGKGATVDYLCSPDADLNVSAVVRFNGGAQAAHNVVVDGRHHTFSQFGSGTFSGVSTILSRYMLVEPFALAGEARQLEELGVPNPLSLIHIDKRALVTTPFHIMMNRAKEDRRGDARHGSCGKGIGETVAFSLDFPDDALRVGDCAYPNIMRRKLTAMSDWCSPTVGWMMPSIDDIIDVYLEFAATVRMSDDGDLAEFANRGRLIFEGAQGVLLDEWRGFHPHTTWSTVEPSNARSMIRELGREPYVLGVTRTYTTRHGAGPMPSERAELDAVLPEPHNGVGQYQGAFRVGDLDLVMLRYAVDVCDGVHGVAVTHLDAVGRAGVVDEYPGLGKRIALGRWQDLEYQQQLTDQLVEVVPVVGESSTDSDAVVALIEEATQASAVLVADGPDRSDRRVLDLRPTSTDE
ncbi:adenylosuccinate synthetase [Gordonia sp. TBRC 11910]|uniref:Adenylosuccinate synthetase n=1 Tax=Gordonia asplenii TaxID=2725283 RepID=A0A848KMN6_9ACTN|nr:adenylosuccinate synthetase [Gordonia asplenii]NMO00344.1 adenylosuccinate synthetase [Gordonia asplenii]